MGLTINGSSLIVKRYLTVKDWGVIFMETAALGGRANSSSARSTTC